MSERMVVTRRVRDFLAEDFAAIDPELPGLLAVLNQRHMAECWHKHGSFRDHLISVYRILALWGQPSEAQLLGLLHSVYSNEYVDLALFDAEGGRGDLVSLVGEEVESLIHSFCTIPRNEFAIALLERDEIPAEGLVLTNSDGAQFALDRRRVGIFLAVTLADLAEQWFAWQDHVMAGYPHVTSDRPTNGHWGAVMWPGPMRPSMTNWSLLSRLARHMPALDLPTPPIFDHCTTDLTPEDEAGATALYWQVANAQIQPASRGSVEQMLEAAIARNPWAAEPRLTLAQLCLMDGDFQRAEDQAQRGLELLCQWGTPWDKRIPWSGWVAWSRVLLQGARDRTWPGTIRHHNNLGMVDAAG